MNAKVGIERSHRGQERSCPGWSAMAYGYLRKWLKTKAAKSNWTVEHFRIYAESRGLSEPANGGAYGHVMSEAKRHGLIKFKGYKPAIKRASRRRPLRVWRAA